MKLTRNRLKELIRQSIKEIDFEDEEAFKKYQSQHKMRPTTKVNIGGKDTTVGQASGDEGGGEEGGEPAAAETPLEKPKDYNTHAQSSDSFKKLQNQAKNNLSWVANNMDEFIKDAEERVATETDPDDKEWAQGYVDTLNYFKQEVNQKVEKQKKEQKFMFNATDEDLSKLGADELENLDTNMWELESKINNAYERAQSQGNDEMEQKYSDMYDKLSAQRSKVSQAKQNVGESIQESVRKPFKTTVKEVKKWFKTLEENRYKKTYASDARRVSWLVNNNLSEDYEAMPVSMKKKWSKAQYGRERYLAKEFIKHKRNEAKLRESIRKIVGSLISEQTLNEVRYQEISISLDDFYKVQKLLKPKKQQIVKHPYSQKTFGLKVDKKQYDKTLEILMKKRIDVQG